MRERTNRTGWILTALLLLLLAGVAFALFEANQEGFTGSRVKNPDCYCLDIQKMNGSDLHTLELRAGEMLRIHFETWNGSMYLEIKAPDGTALYRGNGRDITDFTLNIPEDGVYPIVLVARRAKGTLQIEAMEDTK